MSNNSQMDAGMMQLYLGLIVALFALMIFFFLLPVIIVGFMWRWVAPEDRMEALRDVGITVVGGVCLMVYLGVQHPESYVIGLSIGLFVSMLTNTWRNIFGIPKPEKKQSSKPVEPVFDDYQENYTMHDDANFDFDSRQFTDRQNQQQPVCDGWLSFLGSGQYRLPNGMVEGLGSARKDFVDKTREYDSYLHKYADDVARGHGKDATALRRSRLDAARGALEVYIARTVDAEKNYKFYNQNQPNPQQYGQQSQDQIWNQINQSKARTDQLMRDIEETTRRMKADNQKREQQPSEAEAQKAWEQQFLREENQVKQGRFARDFVMDGFKSMMRKSPEWEKLKSKRDKAFALETNAGATSHERASARRQRQKMDKQLGEMA